ncbi:MAG TPA: cupin domain-containing protein [Solirubrobacteraceae bacterium]|jgi:quercetin dioxygenase-like cupin family protein
MGTSDVVEDPVYGTRYRFHRTTDDDGTEVQHVEMWVQPGGGVTPHVHPAMEERFTVVDGRPEFLGGRRWQAAGAGETVVVPRGTRHAFRNRGDAVAHVRCEARPASSLQAFLEDVAGLSRAGKLHRLGLPKPGGLLEAAVLVEHYRDMVVLLAPAPPPAVQRLIFGPLARLAARRGLRAGRFAAMA